AGLGDQLRKSQHLLIAEARLGAVEADRADDAATMIEIGSGNRDRADKDLAAAGGVAVTSREFQSVFQPRSLRRGNGAEQFGLTLGVHEGEHGLSRRPLRDAERIADAAA